MSPPPPPAIRGIISGALLAGLAALFLLAAPQAEAQTARTYTFTASVGGGPACSDCRANEGDTVTITWTISGLTRNNLLSAVIAPDTSFGGTATQGQDYTGGTVGGEVVWQVVRLEGAGRRRQEFVITDDNAAEPDETIIFALPTLTVLFSDDTFTTTSTDITITIAANDGHPDQAPVDPVTPPVVVPGPTGPTTDSPAARAERLDAPTAAVARGVGQLATEAVTKRLHTVATANQFNIGRANTVDDLLRGGGFNLAAGDGGRGFNFWGSGGAVSAEGDHDGVDYDGDTSAFTLGIDTGWRDGLIGVAVSRSDGDVDFTDADGMESTLETTVTGVHPYLTHRFNRSQLWLTAGHGSGDAELVEPDATIKTDLTVTTAAFGITQSRGELFTAGLSALYSRAKLDEATGGGKTLPATTADTLRITADAEAGWTRGAWRPFITFALRHDSGDGDTGGAADLGGGVEFRTPTVHVRLAGSGHIQGRGADEQRATLTVRKSSGNFDLGLNLAADDSGIDTARLLTGEWRF